MQQFCRPFSNSSDKFCCAHGQFLPKPVGEASCFGFPYLNYLKQKMNSVNSQWSSTRPLMFSIRWVPCSMIGIEFLSGLCGRGKNSVAWPRLIQVTKKFKLFCTSNVYYTNWEITTSLGHIQVLKEVLLYKYRRDVYFSSAKNWNLHTKKVNNFKQEVFESCKLHFDK